MDIISNISSKANIILQENDIINILYNDSRRMEQLSSSISKLRTQSSNDQLSQVVTITGAVKFPGQYPIFKNSSLAEIFIAAGGFKDDALLGSIEISRIDLVDDGLVSPRVIEISALRDLDESNSFMPQSRDRIHVRTVQELNVSDSITLRGEVKYPGIYPLNQGDTLRSLITRAGGLLDSAFVEGAFLQRQTTMAAQRAGNAKLARTIRSSYASSLLTSEEVSNSMAEINSIAEILENGPTDGRVVINLASALSGDKNSNIEIYPNDNLFIPKVISTVTVIGEVNATNSNIYDPSLNVDDYIALAGGFSPRANEDNLYIIKANGSVVPLTKSLFGLGLSRYKVQLGDTIVVPVKASYRDSLGLWGEVTQLIYQSLVSLVALDRITE
jgi:polysaccharide biosynthesis/export protein